MLLLNQLIFSISSMVPMQAFIFLLSLICVCPTVISVYLRYMLSRQEYSSQEEDKNVSRPNDDVSASISFMDRKFY